MAVPLHKLRKVDNKDDTEQKDSSDSETSSKSPEIRAFFDLVDRAHSLQLLNEKNQGSDQKPLKNNFSVWQPSFEPEDFNLPRKRGSTSTVDRSRTSMAVAGAGGDEGKEENKLKKGLKRPRQFVEEGLKRGDGGSKVFDLNKEAESSEGVNGVFG